MKVRGTTEYLNTILAWLETTVGPRINGPTDFVGLKGVGWTMTRDLREYNITRLGNQRQEILYVYEVKLDDPQHETSFNLRWL